MTGASEAPNALAIVRHLHAVYQTTYANAHCNGKKGVIESGDIANQAEAKVLADYLSAAQAAAYERAAQLCVAHFEGSCEIADKIRALGSASALELALAQAKMEVWQELADGSDDHGKHYRGMPENVCEECSERNYFLGRVAELRARIAALSGEKP